MAAVKYSLHFSQTKQKKKKTEIVSLVSIKICCGLLMMINIAFYNDDSIGKGYSTKPYH